MARLSSFALGVIFFTACASASVSFNHKFYHIMGNSFSGTLLGAKQSDDIPFTECKPVNNKQKCVVIFYTELSQIIDEYKNTKQQLIDLQKRCKP